MAITIILQTIRTLRIQKPSPTAHRRSLSLAHTVKSEHGRRVF